MSPHLQFLLVIIVSFLCTMPFVFLAWRRRLPHRRAQLALYCAGYLLIGGTFVVDSIFNPPLFVHGFVPGIGIGFLLGAILQLVSDVHSGAPRLPQ